MAKLTEEMIIARSKLSDLTQVKKLNCWGADLNDVSIIKKLRGVEVLALSVNRISTLEAFENLPNLQELYLRKNNVGDLNELVYLQNLPKLKYLWLEENPCVDTAGPNYRKIVLRALPKLLKLDNVEVTPDEVNDALSAGGGGGEDDAREYIYEDDYQQQSANNNYSNESSMRETILESNIETKYEIDESTNVENKEEYSAPQTSPSHNNYPIQDRQMQSQENYEDSYQKPQTYRDTPTRQKDTSITPSMSTQSMREFNQEEIRSQQTSANNNNSHRSQNDLREMQDSYYGHSRTNLSQQPRYDERREFYSNRNASASREDFAEDVSESRRDLRQTRDGKVPWQFSDYMRRPTNRSSNLLSAVLCLVKELDHSSLEVVEHAVRCRIDELSDSL